MININLQPKHIKFIWNVKSLYNYKFLILNPCSELMEKDPSANPKTKPSKSKNSNFNNDYQPVLQKEERELYEQV